MAFDGPQILRFPKVNDPRGNLTFIQRGEVLPFDIARCYWIYDVPGGQNRHGHAFRTQQELIFAMAGTFDVLLDLGDGDIRRYHLDRPNVGLYVPPLVWRELDNFSSNSLALVISSESFSELDYIRDRGEWRIELASAAQSPIE